jgi:hypothetical protein
LQSSNFKAWQPDELIEKFSVAVVAVNDIFSSNLVDPVVVKVDGVDPVAVIELLELLLDLEVVEL